MELVEDTTAQRNFERLRRAEDIARLVFVGTGSPNGAVTASPGAIYLNRSGGAATTFWVKESGSGNVGWVGK